MAIKFSRSDYLKHLSSKKWKDFRIRVLKKNLRKNKNWCEMCGWDFAIFELEIHHLHYKTLFNEGLKDVAVLCKSCHKKADDIRKKETEEKQEESRVDSAYNTYCEKKYGEEWFCYYDYDEHYEEFEEWISKKEDWY